MKIRLVIEPSDEGVYTVQVPSLPGCISEGKTVQEALQKIHEAIELYLEPAEPSKVFGARCEQSLNLSVSQSVGRE